MLEVRAGNGQRHDHHDYYARHPVMTPDMIRQLPGQHALIIRGGMSPVIARLPMAWNDPAYKAARCSGRATAVLTSVGEPTTLGGGRSQPVGPWSGWDPDLDTILPSGGLDDPDTFPWQ